MGADLATIDAPSDLKENVAACVLWSQENTVATGDDYALTADHLKTIKGALKQADDFFDPPIKQAYDLHKMLVGRKKVITDPLKQSEGLDKEKMLTFQREEAAKAEAERRRLQAIADELARKEREKIEQAAAKQRAIEAEARAKAEQARREAEQANAAERKRLLAEAEAAERKAAAAVAKQEVQAEKAAAVVAPVVAVQSVAPKISGQSTRKAWKAEVVDLAAFLNFVFDNRRADLVLVNDKVLEAYARGMGKQAAMPGVRFFEKESMASAAR